MQRQSWRVAQRAMMTMVVGLLCGPGTAATNYVWTGGSHTSPFDTWATAATTIQAAVDYASATIPVFDTVLVSNGTYNVTAPVTITNGIKVCSVNGPAVTIVQRSGAAFFQVFELTNDVAGAVLSGLTIRNGYVKEDRGGGAGVRMTDGTITNCIIRDNQAVRLTGASLANRGCGIKMSNGLVVDSQIINNSTPNYWSACGGGVYMTGGTLLRCVITNNNANLNNEADGSKSGGGVYVQGAGSVLNCTIKGNRGHYGGGVYLTNGGLLRNCLLANSLEGGGVYMTGGVVENCTVAGNKGTIGDTQSGLKMTDGSVTNTIVWGNQAGFAAVTKTGGAFTYSIAEEVVAGVSNLVMDPRFLDAAAGNYHLGSGSPAIDSGIQHDWMVSATELDGKARINNGTVDRGAFEEDSGTGGLRVYWEGTPPLSGTDSLSVEFSAYPSGSNTTATYDWDFGDGQTQSGPGLTVVTNTFSAGLYTVMLAVTNTDGEAAGSVRSNYIRVLTTAPTYVRPSGSTPVIPYTNWATAAQTIQGAIDAAAGQIVVTDGTYSVTAKIVIDKGVTLTSVNGPAVTTIQRGSGTIRVLELESGASNAVVSGFTIRNGLTPLEFGDNGGAGIQMAAGTVSNCTVRNNNANRDTGSLNYGAGIKMSGGLVVDSRITDNTISTYWSGQGGGVYMTGGVLRGCLITNNSAGTDSEGSGAKRGGGLYLANGTVQNCVIAYNDARYGGGAYLAGGSMRGCLLHHSQAGGGVEMSGGSVENCTITDNLYGDRTYSGLSMSGGGVMNTIVYGNQAGKSAVLKTGGAFHYSVSENVIAGTDNQTTDPGFKDSVALDYSLEPGSLCLDSGTNLDWMTGAVDLEGNQRIVKLRVDMGAYEFVYRRGFIFLVQ